jgi:type IV fimbrial biogenesis protein FimT
MRCPQANPSFNLSDRNSIRMLVKSRGGFTLIEMLVVIAIMAVLMAIALPDFVRMTRAIQLAHQAKEMAGAIKLSRAEAMRRGQTVVMCRSNAAQSACNTGSPSAAWENGWLVFVDLNGNRLYDSASEQQGLIVIKASLPTGMTVTTANGSQIGNYIEFNPAGESAGSLANVGTFRFAHSADANTQNHHYVIINRSGRARVLSDSQCMSDTSCLQ